MSIETQSSVDSPEPTEKPSAKEAVHRLAGEFRHGRWSKGDLARLRKLNAGHMDSAGRPGHGAGEMTFAEVTGKLERWGLLSERSSEKRLNQWACILQTVAMLCDQNASKTRLGTALKQAGLSEQRLSRIIRAADVNLWLQIRRTAHQLYSKGQPVNLGDLAELVLSEGQEHGAKIRRRIVHDYKREGFKQQSDKSDSEAQNQ